MVVRRQYKKKREKEEKTAYFRAYFLPSDQGPRPRERRTQHRGREAATALGARGFAELPALFLKHDRRQPKMLTNGSSSPKMTNWPNIRPFFDEILKNF